MDTLTECDMLIIFENIFMLHSILGIPIWNNMYSFSLYWHRSPRSIKDISFDLTHMACCMCLQDMSNFTSGLILLWKSFQKIIGSQKNLTYR